jgi:Ca2+-binding EF-hand superfamily protein
MEFGGASDLGKYRAGGEPREVPCSSTKIQTLEGKNKSSFGGSSTGSLTGTKSMSAVKEMLEQVDVENRQAEGVSYEMFHEFWSHNLSNRDCETRLFNVLRIAHKSECAVPVSAVRELAAHFVSSRSSDMDPMQMRSLASSLLCYELKGLSWQLIGRHELRQARLCGSLLAAESGMYNGVAANLRADRMSDIRMAFAAASGKRVGGGATLSVKDIIWLNAERGLFTPRAVEAIFEREVCDGGMDLAKFAPMWLSATNPDTRPSCEYLFGILDADADGYINAFDAAHFYMEKRRLLLRDGYIPTAFEHVWRGLLDSVANGKVRSPSGRLQVSLTDLRSIGSRDWTVLFQSLLFMDDDMAMVDIVKTSNSGSAAAC